MRVLLLAPQPFYQERGTPIAVRMLAQTLCQAGHRVDLLTYHLGDNVFVPGLQIFRIPGPQFIRQIPIGFSAAKLLCDCFLFASLIRHLFKNQYDVIHAGEESVYLALMTRFLHRARVVYDMDSSMPDQLLEKWSKLSFLARPLYFMERVAIKKSDVVLPVCQQLADRAYKIKNKDKVVLLEDFPLSLEEKSAEPIDQIRALLGIKGVFALYVGNLEVYQGIDLLLAGFAEIEKGVDLHLVLIGGSDIDIKFYQDRVNDLGVSDRVHLLGPRPVSQLGDYLVQADILVSPRLKGINTPMKIFSYLDSGKSIIATNISSHTQVLDSSCALLVDSKPAAMARGLSQLATDAVLRQTMGQAGQSLSTSRYSFARFQTTVNDLYQPSGPLFD